MRFRGFLLVLLAAALAFSGCGRRGALEAPGEAATVGPAELAAGARIGSPDAPLAPGGGLASDTQSPGAQVADEAAPAAGATAPDRPFFLDPLL